jgi:hypothetical protein
MVLCSPGRDGIHSCILERSATRMKATSWSILAAGVAILALGAWPAPAAWAEEKAAAPAAPEKPLTKLDEIDAWIEKTKTIAPWFTWGADLRFRADYTNNNSGLNQELAGHETSQQKYRPRWWGTVTPTKGLDLNMRITWEGRHFSVPAAGPDFDHSMVLMDTLNVKATNFLGTPLSFTVGRQDIVLGDGWLVSDGTPIDGTRTAFFDAARFTLEIKEVQTLLDFIYIDNHYTSERWWAPMLHADHQANIEQDERGFIFYATNRSMKNTEISGYYMYKENDRRLRNGDDGHIHTFGGRVTGDITERWKYRAEGAHQFGLRNDRYLRAFGFNSAATYLVKDAWKHQVRGTYEFLSGDDPDTRTNEAFVPLWSRWDRWTHIQSNTYTLEGRRYEFTNLHRFGPGVSSNPTDKLELVGDYFLLFADENSMTGARNRVSFSENGKFRGQMIQTQARYQFTKHLKGRVLVEFFFPGNYYTDFRNDVATFLRGEIIFTW